MSDFVAGPRPGGHSRAGDPPPSGAVPVLVLAALAALLLVGVIFMSILMTEGGDASTPVQPVAAAGAGEDRVLLEVSFEGDGSGEIEFDPGTASCSRNCRKEFPTGVRLTVTARPAEDSTFDGWRHACNGDGRCSFVIDDNLSLTVAFEAKAVKERKEVKPACKGLLPGEVNPECSGDGAGDDPLTRSDCLDGRDNDGDGLTDAAQDPSCDDGGLESGRAAAPAAPPPPRPVSDCSDGKDNDSDGLTDTEQDPDCLEGENESGTPSRDGDGGGGAARPGSDCGDGRDNDGDGLIDTAQDPGCEKDRSEAD